MTQAPAYTTPQERELSPNESRPLLDAAARAGATVWIRVQTSGPCSVYQAELVGSEEGCIVVETSDAAAIAQDASDVRDIAISVEFDDRRLAWRDCGAVEQSKYEPDRLVIRCSVGVNLSERRRSPRRTLRSPSVVSLMGIDDQADWFCTGAMLNLSDRGLACRVENSPDVDQQLGQTVRFTYRVTSCGDLTQGEGRIVSVTPGGSPGTCVLGMEFVRDPANDGSCRSRDC